LELRLYLDSTVEPFAKISFNKRKVFLLLEKLKEHGINVSIIDTAGWNKEMIYEVYLNAARVAIFRGYKAYRIRKIFGSARDSGKYFGREVPALLVYDKGEVIDVYPHEEKGKLITIEEFLEEKLRELERKEGGEHG